MSLVERLGYRTLDEFYEENDNNMIMEWLAYDLTKDQEWKEKTQKEISLENQKDASPEDEANRIRALFGMNPE